MENFNLIPLNSLMVLKFPQVLSLLLYWSENANHDCISTLTWYSQEGMSKMERELLPGDVVVGQGGMA